MLADRLMDGDPLRPLQYSLNGLGLAVREILGEVGFRELMQRGAHHSFAAWSDCRNCR
jgi:hypothetical protein